MIDVGDFLSAIRAIIEQQTKDMSSDAVCEISEVNEDGTLNIFILADKQTVLRNIVNASKFEFKPGDTALLYKIKNRLSNSFIITKL